MDPETIKAIEQSLRRIRGVDSARIRTDGDAVFEVHVVADPDRAERDLVHDIITALYARHGLSIDPQQIRVATARAAEVEEDWPELPEVGKRILFRSVNVYREGNRAEAQVELLHGGEILIGTASGPAISASLPRLVARATLEALAKPLGNEHALELLSLERRRLGGRRIMLCHLVVLKGRNETHLSGSVLVTSDTLEAAVLSVLDALNRILPGLEGESVLEYEVDALSPEARA